MKVAAFNVHRFGLAKVSQPPLLAALVKIVSRYDIVVLLEVVDVSGESIRLFVEELNRANAQSHYALQLSARLGRNRNKEQYMFLYRDDVVDLVDSFQFGDGPDDAFNREPYVLRFKPRNTVVDDLVLIPVHAGPWDTERELHHLYEVFLAARDRWRTDNILILGDLRADGVYVTPEGLEELRIRKDKSFHWLIGDDIDTTTTSRNAHTYDRLVAHGEQLLSAIVPNSAKAFNFQAEFSMSESMALRISDHYPVEVELLEATPFWETSKKQPRSIIEGEVLQLQKENLLLEREKLQLQISLLKLRLSEE